MILTVKHLRGRELKAYETIKYWTFDPSNFIFFLWFHRLLHLQNLVKRQLKHNYTFLLMSRTFLLQSSTLFICSWQKKAKNTLFVYIEFSLIFYHLHLCINKLVDDLYFLKQYTLILKTDNVLVSSMQLNMHNSIFNDNMINNRGKFKIKLKSTDIECF